MNKVDQPETSTTWRRHFILPLILLLNFGLRYGLEHHLHVPYFDPETQSHPLGLYLLWPVHIDDQCLWITSSHYPVELLCRGFGASGAFYILNALAIVCTYVTSWQMVRSRTFTWTMTLCMALGTQFHYSYVLAGTFVMYVQVIYLQIIALCGFKMLTAERTRWWRAGFLGMVLFMSIGFDTWLNFYVFLVPASALLYWFYHKRGETNRLAEIRFAVLSLTAWLVIWMPIKLHTGRHHFKSGKEDEVILTYRRPVLAVEDFTSNLITYTYMATTNYLPAVFITSNSDYLHGSDKILAEQKGYHQAYGHYVTMHHHFLWYHHAGFVFAAYLYFLGRSSLRTIKDPRALGACCVAVLLIGIGTGSATHVMIKFRPYMSVPALSYKCMPSILAMTYLLAFLLMRARQKWDSRALSASVVAGCWGLIVTAALTRPALLDHLHAKAGLGQMSVDPGGKLLELVKKGSRVFGFQGGKLR